MMNRQLLTIVPESKIVERTANPVRILPCMHCEQKPSLQTYALNIGLLFHVPLTPSDQGL